jgi:hypothetical protein
LDSVKEVDATNTKIDTVPRGSHAPMVRLTGQDRGKHGTRLA